MKKTWMTLMVLALCTVGLFGASAVANAQPGWGGHRPYAYRYAYQNPEAQALMQKHWDAIEPLQRQLYAKQAELDAKIAAGASDAEIKALSQDIIGLSAKLH